jgi:hypothetical protein
MIESIIPQLAFHPTVPPERATRPPGPLLGPANVNRDHEQLGKVEVKNEAARGEKLHTISPGMHRLCWILDGY